MNTSVIKSLEDLKREFAPIINVNEIHRSRLSKSDKAAVFITRHVGTLTFFYLCIGFVIIPFMLPTTLPIIQYISAGLLQLLLLPLIMISQNLQNRHSELIAQHDYQTTLKTEREIEAVLMHLERQEDLMQEILKKMEKSEHSKK